MRKQDRRGRSIPEEELLKASDFAGPSDEEVDVPEGDLTEEVIRRVPSAREEKKAKRRRRGIAFAKLVCVLVIIGCLLYAGGYAIYDHYRVYYSTHFYEGTTINGTDVSFRTADVIKRSIANDIGRYTLTIEEKGGITETLTAEDVGWAYVDDGAVDAFMESQDAAHWYRHYKDGQVFEVSAGTTYDRELALTSIRALTCFQPEFVTEPADAMLIQTSDGNYAVQPEIEGNKLQETLAEETILQALDGARPSVSLLEPDCYTHPGIFSDNENLCRRRDQWNRLLGIHLTYEFGDNYEDIDRSFLLDYITDDGDNVTLSTEWVSDLVYRWGSRYDTFGRDRSFTTYDGKTIVVPGGDYGWCINKEATIAELTEAVEQAESGVRHVVWLYEAMGWDNGDLTGTYVEVSLSQQKLWCYKNYELVMATDVVTGQPTGDRATTPGVYAIDAKKSPAVLGTLDVQGYSSPVSWWCPFNGGQGLHDAPWRNAFGGSIYQSNGSHGCVNIPEDRMETIYNTVSIGTAVIVY